MTQKKLCEKVNLSISSLSAYECNVSPPPSDVLRELSKALGVTSDYLLGLDERKTFYVDGLRDSDMEIINDIINMLKISK